MDIMGYYQKKANNYYNISMYLIVICVLYILYGLITVMSKHLFIISSLLICVSILFQIMYRFYERKIANIQPVLFNELENYHYINFQNRPILHLNFYSTSGHKLLEIKDNINVFLYYLLPKCLVVSGWKKVTLNNKVNFYIDWSKKELKYQFNKEEFHIQQKNNEFLVNGIRYQWKEQPLLFDFEIMTQDEVVFIGQKGKMKVKEAEIFQNPNMPSIRFSEKINESQKIILLAILVLKWSGKYS